MQASTKDVKKVTPGDVQAARVRLEAARKAAELRIKK